VLLVLPNLVACADVIEADPSDSEASVVDSGEALSLAARPSSVPKHYVFTPNGWFDPKCVIEVGEDEIVRSDAKIESTTGASREISACASPRYTAKGTLVTELDEIADKLDTAQQLDGTTDSASATDSTGGTVSAQSTKPLEGWLESANTTALGPIRYVHTQWNVPPDPKSKGSQTVYYFPGLENSKSTKSILQPVLGWNQSEGPKGWSLASWNCCVKGTTQHSKFITTKAGGTVSADIGGSSCSSNGVCSKWQIVSYDWSSGRSVTLDTSAYGVPLNWLFGGVLEVYGITNCDQLPGGTVRFSDFYVTKAPSGTHVKLPKWNISVNTNASPACGYGITQYSDGDVLLKY
jgi:hypothetical protein